MGLLSCKKDQAERTEQTSGLLKVNQKLIEFKASQGTDPTVVFISGFDTPMDSWDKVIREVPVGSGWFAYNRPGTGRSENVTGERHAIAIAKELKLVLEAGKVKAPFVLVAHSMGGIYARMFYHMYPELVVGLVLAESTHERTIDSLLSMIPLPDRNYLSEYLDYINDSTLECFQPGSVKEEFRANYRTNFEQIKATAPISGIPVYVLSGTQATPGGNPLSAEMTALLRNEWAEAAGSSGKHVITPLSGHFIQLEQPGMVAEAIRWVLNQ